MGKVIALLLVGFAIYRVNHAQNVRKQQNEIIAKGLASIHKSTLRTVGGIPQFDGSDLKQISIPSSDQSNQGSFLLRKSSDNERWIISDVK